MYVEFSQPYVPFASTLIACHAAGPVNTSAYCRSNMSADTCATTSATSLLLGQMSFRNTSLPSLLLADRILRQVDPHRAGNRIRHDQRWRCQPVRAHFLVHPPLEVPVTRQHRRNHQVALRDRLRDLFRQRTRVADARRATVADEVEAEFVERRLQSGLGEILGDDFRARRERRLHPRLHRQAERERFLRNESRREHHRWIRRVGARRDRGDHDVAMAEVVAASRHFRARVFRFARPADRVRHRPLCACRSSRRDPAGASVRRGSARRCRDRVRACRCRRDRPNVASRHMPCAFAYASTSATVSAGRPDSFR